MTDEKTTEKPRGLSLRWGQNPLAALREELEDLVTRFVGETADGWLPDRMALSLDVSETETTVDVQVDLPGVDVGGIDLSLSGQVLTIRGQRPLKRDEQGRTYHRAERPSGRFCRTVQLPCPVREDKVKAEYCDGVLTVTLPKSEEARGRKIKVKRAKEAAVEQSSGQKK